MNILLRTWIFIGILSTSILGAEYSGKGDIEISHYAEGKYGRGASVQGSLDLRWKIWTLVGEPVDMLEARWSIQSVNFDGDKLWEELKNPVGGSLVYKVCGDKETYHCIPKHIMKQASIIDLKIYGFMTHDSSIWASTYLFDAGVMSKPAAHSWKEEYGPWSYNRPGSPSWEKTFINSMSNDLKISGYHDADTAKRLMKQGFEIKSSDLKIAEIKFNLNALKRYIIKRNEEYYREQEHERYDSVVTQSDDPFEVLEKLDQQKSSGKKFRSSDKDLNEEYGAAERKLEKDARKKEKILQLTKDRVAKRRLPTKATKDVWVDESTGLMWYDKDDPTYYLYTGGTWAEVKQYCHTLSGAGYSDWKMPSVEELKSLVNKTKNFKYQSVQWVWSSNSNTIVFTGDGEVDDNRESTKDHSARCVRKSK